MLRSTKKPSRARKKIRNILDELSPNEAIAILKMLVKEDQKIKARIVKLAAEYISQVNIDKIVSLVYSSLNAIRVEELWDRSGATRNGYVDPSEMAWEMFEEALGPFLEELRRYQRLSMRKQAMNYCMGILKGIYKFHTEPQSEYKDWAVDAPYEYFHMILEEWEKGCREKDDINKMEDFINENCPGW